MSLASLIGIDRERYDAGNKFLSQDRFLANYNPRDAITFNVSPNINTGIMGPRVYPYPPIFPPGDGDDGGSGLINTKDPYGYTGPGSSKSLGGFNIDDIGEGTIDEEDILTGGNLTKTQLAKAYGNYFAFGPLGGAYSVYKSNKENEQKEKDILKKELDRVYGQDRDQFKDIRDGSAPSGGTWDGGQAAYTNPATGIGGGQFTDELGNVDYQDALDPGSGEKDGGLIDGSNRRKFYQGGEASLDDAKMMAPKGEFLAYINPKEAQMLKNAGGSGVMTPMGIPSFTEDEEDTGDVANPGSVGSQSVNDGFEGEEGPVPTYSQQYDMMTKTGGGDDTIPPTFRDDTPNKFQEMKKINPAFTYTSNYGKLGGILDLTRTIQEEEPVGSIGYADPFGNFSFGYNTDLGKVATGRLGDLNVGYTDLIGPTVDYRLGDLNVGYSDLSGPTVDYMGAFANDAGRFGVNYNRDSGLNLGVKYKKQFNNGGIVGLYR
jgi:hypothetical protein